MNCETGHCRHRAPKVDEHTVDLFVFHTASDFAGQRQVSVKPGREQDSTVNFYTQLQKALTPDLRCGFDLETRAVGVGADQPQPLISWMNRACSDCHD